MSCGHGLTRSVDSYCLCTPENGLVEDVPRIHGDGLSSNRRLEDCLLYRLLEILCGV